MLISTNVLSNSHYCAMAMTRRGLAAVQIQEAALRHGRQRTSWLALVYAEHERRCQSSMRLDWAQRHTDSRAQQSDASCEA